MSALRSVLIICLIALLLPVWGAAQATDAMAEKTAGGSATAVLSPVWEPGIRRWESHIAALSDAYGLDPDFIAAVIRAESSGNEHGVSWAGAVGLMGIMPREYGFERRPTSEDLKNPAVNLRWGVTILSEVIRQSGGDIGAALAAYNGGWRQVDHRTPRAYAAGVLDYYGRAVAARNGISPDMASRWTVALKIEGGNIPAEPLILGQEPLSGLQMLGEHVVYEHVTADGRSYYVKGYAVPLAIVVPAAADGVDTGDASALEDELMVRLALKEVTKEQAGNPRVLLACLPSLSRLRGRVNTRWFSPSYCPSWQR